MTGNAMILTRLRKSSHCSTARIRSPRRPAQVSAPEFATRAAIQDRKREMGKGHSRGGHFGGPPANTGEDRTGCLSMQSEAKRSRGPLLPAICDLQGDFQKLQGEPVLRYEI